MAIQDFTIDAVKKIRSAIGMEPVVSPIEEAPLSSRGKNVIKNDIKSFVKATPAGDLYRRITYAKQSKAPPPLSPQEYLDALRVLGVLSRPDIAAKGFIAGGVGKIIENEMYGMHKPDNVIDSGINTARDVVLISPFLKKEFQDVVSGGNKMMRMNYLELLGRKIIEQLK